MKSIPAVFALRDGKVVDGFIGAQPEAAVAEFVAKLAPQPTEADLLAEQAWPPGRGTVAEALELQPDHAGAIVGLAGLLIADGETDEALAILARIPETPETRRLQAEARLAAQQVSVTDDGDRRTARRPVGSGPRGRQRQAGIRGPVGDPGPADPRTTSYRKALSARLF